MNATAAATIADRLLEGARDTLRTMLTEALDSAVDDTAPTSQDLLLSLCGELPVAMTGVLPNNMGGIALLLPEPTALALAALLGDSPDTATAVGDDEKSLLADLAETLLSSAVAHLMESWGQGFGQFSQVACFSADEAAEKLPLLLGQASMVARIRFLAHPRLAGPAALMFSESFSELLPGAAPVAPPPAPPKPAPPQQQAASSLLSDEEMQDILNGFGLPPEVPAMAAPANMGAPAADKATRHENLDVVLDITLTAVARLGGIDMPLGDILGLGPGAIIEVGHMVDEPVELLVNGRLIAKGEVVVVDEKFGLRITEIVSPRARIESLR